MKKLSILLECVVLIGWLGFFAYYYSSSEEDTKYNNPVKNYVGIQRFKMLTQELPQPVKGTCAPTRQNGLCSYFSLWNQTCCAGNITVPNVDLVCTDSRCLMSFLGYWCTSSCRPSNTSFCSQSLTNLRTTCSSCIDSLKNYLPPTPTDNRTCENYLNPPAEKTTPQLFVSLLNSSTNLAIEMKSSFVINLTLVVNSVQPPLQSGYYVSYVSPYEIPSLFEEYLPWTPWTLYTNPAQKYDVDTSPRQTNDKLFPTDRPITYYPPGPKSDALPSWASSYFIEVSPSDLLDGNFVMTAYTLNSYGRSNPSQANFSVVLNLPFVEDLGDYNLCNNGRTYGFMKYQNNQKANKAQCNCDTCKFRGEKNVLLVKQLFLAGDAEMDAVNMIISDSIAVTSKATDLAFTSASFLHLDGAKWNLTTPYDIYGSGHLFLGKSSNFYIGDVLSITGANVTMNSYLEILKQSTLNTNSTVNLRTNSSVVLREGSSWVGGDNFLMQMDDGSMISGNGSMLVRSGYVNLGNGSVLKVPLEYGKKSTVSSLRAVNRATFDVVVNWCGSITGQDKITVNNKVAIIENKACTLKTQIKDSMNRSIVLTSSTSLDAKTNVVISPGAYLIYDNVSPTSGWTNINGLLDVQNGSRVEVNLANNAPSNTLIPIIRYQSTNIACPLPTAFSTNYEINNCPAGNPRCAFESINEANNPQSVSSPWWCLIYLRTSIVLFYSQVNTIKVSNGNCNKCSPTDFLVAVNKTISPTAALSVEVVTTNCSNGTLSFRCYGATQDSANTLCSQIYTEATTSGRALANELCVPGPSKSSSSGSNKALLALLVLLLIPCCCFILFVLWYKKQQQKADEQYLKDTQQFSIINTVNDGEKMPEP